MSRFNIHAFGLPFRQTQNIRSRQVEPLRMVRWACDTETKTVANQSLRSCVSAACLVLSTLVEYLSFVKNQPLLFLLIKIYVLEKG